jgi:flagellin
VIYFNPDAAELRSVIQFNRISLQLADSMRKLETGQRINEAKDDPSGLIISEPMRAEIKGIQAAQNNVKGANAVLDAADTGLSVITDIIRGEMQDDSGMSLLGIVMSADLSSDEKKTYIADRLTLIDGIADSAAYGSKKVLDGSIDAASGGALFNLGKNVGENVQRIAIESARSSALGGTSGTLYGLQFLDFDDAADAARGVDIIKEALSSIANERAKIGWTQNSVSRISDSLDRVLIDVTEAEAAISETDVTMESSRATRLDLLAQSAMNAVLFHRSFASYIAGSLF